MEYVKQMPHFPLQTVRQIPQSPLNRVRHIDDFVGVSAESGNVSSWAQFYAKMGAYHTQMGKLYTALANLYAEMFGSKSQIFGFDPNNYSRPRLGSKIRHSTPEPGQLGSRVRRTCL